MKNEKMANITAELRDLHRAMDVTQATSADGQWIAITVFGKPIREYFGELADRIDAASLCERAETATIAATIATNLASGKRGRNCDKYDTPEELRRAFGRFCRQRSCVACKFERGTKCEFQYALAPASVNESKEGEA